MEFGLVICGNLYPHHYRLYVQHAGKEEERCAEVRFLSLKE